MHRALLLTATLALLAPVLVAGVPARAEEGCNPEPIGRCGAYQRERVWFCYVVGPDGRLLDPTDRNVVRVGQDPLVRVSLADPIGQPVGVGDGEQGLLYLRLAPVQSLAADPLGAGPPGSVLYEETNEVAGLQTQRFFCGLWVWFAEFGGGLWMGSHSHRNPQFPPDDAAL